MVVVVVVFAVAGLLLPVGVVAVGLTATALSFETLGAVAIATSVVTVGVKPEAAAPLMVVLRLALPWKTDKIFFDVLLSRSGRMTAALSIMVPVPGIV